ncbi:hypothetical protein, partial [Pseudomonas syringae group genomosp. 3]|uniref:hypothetical protein n=1 Tax=Pseudomonas syringae group genomosp. 3 TaxID=251701 RepID=UPI0016051E60
LVFGINSLFLLDKFFSAIWPGSFEVASGVLSVKVIGRDEYLAISGTDEIVVLSCSLGFTGTTRCLSAEKLQQLLGARVIAHWYRQSIYGGIKKNKLVSLEVNGVSVISFDRTKSLDESNIQTTAVITGIVVGFLFLGFLIIMLKQGRSRGPSDP